MVGRRIAGRTLVLGGSGFLGSHVVEALLDRGGSVRVFDRDLPRDVSWASDVEVCCGDFTKASALFQVVEGCRTVVHLVATTLPKTSDDDPAADVEGNVLSTIRFLDAARRAGVERVVFASSGGTVYGIPQTIPIAEDHVTFPLCSYGIHKLAIEHYLRLYRRLHGLDYRVLRLSNPFGERQLASGVQGVVAVFLAKAVRGDEVTILGDGSAVRDYIYVEDAARAFVCAIENEGPERTFNIGSGAGVSIHELLSAIEAVYGRAVSRRYLPARPFDVPANVLDVTRARTHLGWEPAVALHEGLRRTLAWVQAQLRPEPS